MTAPDASIPLGPINPEVNAGLANARDTACEHMRLVPSDDDILPNIKLGMRQGRFVEYGLTRPNFAELSRLMGQRGGSGFCPPIESNPHAFCNGHSVLLCDLQHHTASKDRWPLTAASGAEAGARRAAA